MADHGHDDHGAGASHPPKKMRNDTPKTLIKGIAISLLLGILAYLLSPLVFILVGIDFSNQFVTGVLLPLFSYLFGFGVAALVFLTGLYYMQVGEKGYAMLLGDPAPLKDLKLGPGWGWGFPVLITFKIRPGRGLPINPGVKENETKNGIEVTSDVSGTYIIEDLRLVEQTIDAGAVDEFVTAELVAAMRDFIANETIHVEEDLHEGEMKTSEAFHLISMIAEFRHTIEKNGDAIIKAVNDKIQPLGLRLTTLQIEDVDVPKEISDAAKRIVSETIEAGGLLKDAKNKKGVAKELLTLYAEMGVDLDKLVPAEAADHVSRALDSALASEDKARVVRHNFGGRPPAGSFINTGE